MFKPDQYFSFPISKRSFLSSQTNPFLWLCYCSAKLPTEGLQRFAYSCSFLSFKNLYREDHEALIESLSGLVR